MATKRGDLLLMAFAAVGAVVFLCFVGRLWPLPPLNLFPDRDRLATQARDLLSRNGISTRGFESSVDLTVLEGQMDYLEQEFGRTRTLELLKEGAPTIRFTVSFRKSGVSDLLSVQLLPDGRPVNFLRSVREEEKGVRLPVNDARAIAERSLTSTFGLNLADWTPENVSSRELTTRRDHLFVYSHPAQEYKSPRMTAVVRIAGDKIVMSGYSVREAPGYSERTARENWGRRALDLIGMLLLGAATFGGYLVFLKSLQAQLVGLRRPLLWSGTVFLCTLGAWFLIPPPRDTLTPPFVSWLQNILNNLQASGWSLIALMALAAAGDALDRVATHPRGESLRLLTRGKLFTPSVGAAAGRGFLLGFVCAGVLAITVALLERFCGARIALQPRGFFLVGLNAVFPPLWSLLYFLHVALLEELGYRYFAGAWLLQKTRQPLIAIALPAILYGLTHTGVAFLPPEDPFWARPLAMTLVGCVWGWAFLRYDALTVIVSHLCADLFIFNWPQLASGNPTLVLPAAIVVLLPLLPTLGNALRWLFFRKRTSLIDNAV